MYGTFWSLVPFLVVIPIAVLTRQVLPGLLVGLLIGSYMLHPGMLAVVDTALAYILKELAVPDNLRLIVFMYGFGAFVGLLRVSGGVAGFADWAGKRIKTVRGAFGVTWLSSLATFMAPDFRIITVSPVMKQVFSRLNVPADKVAFVIDATSTPLVALVPLGTAFIGYMVGLLGTALRHQGAAASPYQLFLSSVPFNFFGIAMLVFALFYTFMGRHKTSEHTAHNVETKSPVRSTGYRAELQAAYMETAHELSVPLPYGKEWQQRLKQKTTEDDLPDCIDPVAEKAKPSSLNLILPLGLLLALTLFLTWWDGHFRSASFFGALAQANAAKAMLEALLWTLLAAFIWYTVQRQPLQRTLFGFLQGGNEMMGVNILLVLVWAVSAVSTDLGFVTYTTQIISRLVPGALIAPAIFVFGCLLSYAIGSSFGTWGILLPIGFSLAANTHTALPLIAGAVFASGTFGGFASPLSDNTVAMATVMKLPVMEYAHKKLIYGGLVAGACALLYAVAGWLHF